MAPVVEQQKWTCPRCSRTISSGDTVVFGPGPLSQLDCQQPRLLSAEERALLFTYCRDHPVGQCIEASNARVTSSCPNCLGRSRVRISVIVITQIAPS